MARLQGFKDWNTCAAVMDKKENVLPIPSGWQAGGDRREHYDIGIDTTVMFEGSHPAIIRYRENAPQNATGFATFMQSFDAEDYRGKRVQFSSTIMCEDCDGAATIWVRADSDTVQAVGFDNLESKGVGHPSGPISGTTDWTKRTIVLDIPEAATKMSIGFYVRGKEGGYAAGFSMKQVSENTQLTSGERVGRSDPVNLRFIDD